MDENPVNSVSRFIEEINAKVSKYKKMYPHNDSVVVFRGESFDYQHTACMPNIFRTEDIKNNKKLEKTLFDEMAAQGIVSKSDYLTSAINAQHGGFPSRLLDVTYNALTALYFATEANSLDKSDSKAYIYIFYVNNIFTTSSEEAIAHYNRAIDLSNTREKAYYFNHKLIDHSKLNKRIIAQQGAFILFPGDRHYPIKNIPTDKIIIERKYKNKIQNELATLFGITKGFIYPEADYQVQFVKEKLHRIETELPSEEYELKLAIKSSENLIENHRRDIFEFASKDKKDINFLISLVNKFEREVINISEIIIDSEKSQKKPTNILAMKNECYKKIDQTYKRTQFILSKYSVKLTKLNKLLK